jgi:hypothetical protein
MLARARGHGLTMLAALDERDDRLGFLRDQVAGLGRQRFYNCASRLGWQRFYNCASRLGWQWFHKCASRLGWQWFHKCASRHVGHHVRRPGGFVTKNRRRSRNTSRCNRSGRSRSGVAVEHVQCKRAATTAVATHPRGSRCDPISGATALPNALRKPRGGFDPKGANYRRSTKATSNVNAQRSERAGFRAR